MYLRRCWKLLLGEIWFFPNNSWAIITLLPSYFTKRVRKLTWSFRALTSFIWLLASCRMSLSCISWTICSVQEVSCKRITWLNGIITIQSSQTKVGKRKNSWIRAANANYFSFKLHEGMNLFKVIYISFELLLSLAVLPVNLLDLQFTCFN